MGCENIIETFFHLQHTLKLYHWQTTSYARHMGSDGLLGTLGPLIDQFVEVYMGRYKRPRFENGLRLTIEQLSDDTIIEALQYYIKYMKNEVPKNLRSSDTDLLNINDEIIGALNKTMYLFTLG